MQTQERAYHSDDVVCFLRVLMRKIRSKLLVIWDGSLCCSDVAAPALALRHKRAVIHVCFHQAGYQVSPFMQTSVGI